MVRVMIMFESLKKKKREPMMCGCCCFENNRQTRTVWLMTDADTLPARSPPTLYNTHCSAALYETDSMTVTALLGQCSSLARFLFETFPR